MAEKIHGAVYGNTQHVLDYIREKKLPSIHHDMGIAMDQVPVQDRVGAIDLGACLGMLSLRALAMGWRMAVGLEVDRKAVMFSNAHIRQDGFSLRRSELRVQSDAFAQDIIGLASTGYKTVLARRVLPELFVDTYRVGTRERGATAEAQETIRANGQAFTRVMRQAGIRELIVEGRVVGSDPAHPMFSLDHEIAALGPEWVETFRHHRVAILRLR